MSELVFVFSLHHYLALHRHIRYALEGLTALVAILMLLNAVAALYPANRAVPFAHIGAHASGGMSAEQMTVLLGEEDIRENIFSFRINEHEYMATAEALGLEVDPELTVAKTYQTDRGLFPLLDFVGRMQRRDVAYTYTLDTAAFASYVMPLREYYTYAPVNATIEISEEGEVTILESQEGSGLDVDRMALDFLSRVNSGDGSLPQLYATSIEPSRETEYLVPLKEHVQMLIDTPVVLTLDAAIFTPDKKIVSQWVGLRDIQPGDHLEAYINREGVAAYIASIASELDVVSQPGAITTLDGVTIAETAGSPGVALDQESAVTAIVQQLEEQGEVEVDLRTLALPPHVIYNKQYSKTSTGLTALIADWEATHSGDYGIMVQELGGQRRRAEYQANKPYVTASTYKMFLAYAVLRKVEEGAVSLGQLTNIGWTVDACITEMISHSTNPCAIALGQMIGWGTVDGYLREKGFTITTLNVYDQNGAQVANKMSSASEEGMFLEKLNNGELLNAAHTAKLLGLLKAQIWRYGIPTGVPGVEVADKVGFLWSYIHDVAIVYDPNGHYILAIMSNGGSYANFADLSRVVNGFFK